MLILVSAAAGAFAFRGRGGVFNEILGGHLTTQAGRSLYGIVLAALLIGRLDLIGLALFAVAAFLGCLAPWFTDDRFCKTFSGFLLMTARGPAFTIPGTAVLWWFGLPWLPFGLSGLALGACYLLAAVIPSKIHDLEQGPALGEALFGAAVGAALAI